MLLQTLLSTTFLLTLTAAAPSLGARGCSIGFPSTIISLDQKAPTTASGKTLKIRALQSAGGTGREAMEFQFTNIPANSYGCQLELNFPAGTSITNQGSSQIDTYVLDRDISVADTWNRAPGKSYLFGTTNVYSDPGMPTTVVVNSVQCKPTLNFRVEIASQTQAGVMAFAQQNPPSTQPVGFRLTHNC
ncbi:hypothetical protein M501DRAFT_862803 [Patellaria atrata CBS 101060]|uniref:Ubiquitin 3 binding protein But2 C-terminal domain-containing protein n=1 Tax=Patellaria atrata CBS 101060 TaxID=1346257 RepID=A0A9P4VQV5_9PEZI|nr:hypothetical protein M501DRAFT_862803 [Patellaria atrata CBS 101060]